jgi:hypothetical protein
MGDVHHASAKRREHQGLVTRLSAQVSAFVSAGQCKSYVSPIDLFLPSGEEDLDQIDLVVQPDIAVVCDPEKLIAKGIRGAPDLLTGCRPAFSRVWFSAPPPPTYSRRSVDYTPW